MTKEIRLIILLICVACFFAATPFLVAYSMGYRFDFGKMKVVATGGIYIRTFPSADQISVDEKYFEKPGMFANSVFVQNLLPAEHSVSIKKEGFYDYNKTLPVVENKATKLENVLLFKKNIMFQEITDLPTGQAGETQDPFLAKTEQEKFVIVGSNLYYSDSTQNKNLTTLQKNTAIIKSLVAFTISNNNFVWLSATGFLNQSDLTGKNPVKISEKQLKIIKTGNYKISIYGQNIFINNNGNLLTLNKNTDVFDVFANSVKDFKFSPDGKNIIYFTDKQVYVYLFPDETDEASEKTLLYKSENIINDCIWLNNDYIIISAGNKIIISEIDYRGNINSIEIAGDFKLPQIIFNQQDNKLYILSQKTLLASDKLTQ